MKTNIERAREMIQEMKSDTIAQLRARSKKDNPDAKFREVNAYYKGYVIGIETAEMILNEIFD